MLSGVHYAFLFWGGNSLTNRRSYFPLNWASYQIWTKATGEVCYGVNLGYIYCYVVFFCSVSAHYPGVVEYCWTFVQKRNSDNTLTLSGCQWPFLRSELVRFAIFILFLSRASNSLKNRKTCFPLNRARYRIRTKPTGEISATALIPGYICRYAVSLPSRRNYYNTIWSIS